MGAVAVAGPATRRGVVGALSSARSSRPLWPYGALLAILAATMGRAWVTADRLLVDGDLLAGYYPWHVLMREVVAGRESFFWNPYAFGGIPTLPTPHAGFAYPLHWLMTPLPPMLAVNWLLGLHVLLAGVGAAWCAGRLGASRDGMFVSGIACGLGSALTARLYAGHILFVEASAWLPVCLGAVAAIGRPGQVCVLAGAVAMMTLAEQPELLLFGIWLLPLCAAGLAIQHHRPRAGLEIARSPVRTGAGLALGIGLAAYFLLPFLAFAQVSNRSVGLSWAFQTGASLPPWHLLTALAPLALGDPRTAYWPGPAYMWRERLLYVGVIPLVAALWAPDRRRAIWLLVAAITVLVSLGSYGPFFGWAQVLPGYSVMRVPPKHLIVTALAAGLRLERLRGRSAALALVLLAAGVGLLGSRITPATRLLIGATSDPKQFELDQVGAALSTADGPLYLAAGLLGLAALSVALADRLPRRLARLGRLGLLGVLCLDLLLVLQAFRTVISDPRIVTDGLEPFESLGRVAFVGSRAVFAGNYGPVTRLMTPSGYQSIFGAAYMELLMGGANPGVLLYPLSVDDPALALLGYRYVVPPERRTVIVVDPAPPTIWVARCAWPGRARDVRAPFAPRTSRARCASSTHPRRRARRRARPGRLVTTIPWYPGWRASVDGALVGVRLGDGAQLVDLRYVPAGWEAGLGLTALAALLVAVAWLADRHWRRLPPWIAAWWRPSPP
jgi:hypothetical protein